MIMRPWILSAVGALLTALAVASPHPARAVAGSDGVTHLEYDLVITNAFTADATLTELVVQDENGRRHIVGRVSVSVRRVILR